MGTKHTVRIDHRGELVGFLNVEGSSPEELDGRLSRLRSTETRITVLPETMPTVPLSGEERSRSKLRGVPFEIRLYECVCLVHRLVMETDDRLLRESRTH